MSRIKSLIYSAFVASNKKYQKENFDEGYFSKGKSFPDEKRARYYLNFFKPCNVLDVGCGTGNLVWGFLKTGVDAEGIDVSEHAINRAHPEVRPSLKLGDILNLDYPDNKFDLVTCSDVLEHIPQAECEKVIQDLYKITGKWLALNICLWTEKNARKDPTHINLHSKRWWTKKIERLGYRTLKTPDGFPSKRNAFVIKKDPLNGSVK
ncbi:MAG: class I SAM-dependent methyltransferase [Nitrospinales bacterium]